MSKYNFYSSLEPERFEHFSCAIISIRENITFQRFGAGPDGGIDGLYCSDDRKIVLQAKRIQASKSRLLSILKKEVTKAEQMDIERYILVLSESISSISLKNEIYEMFHGLIKDTHDIVTCEDLNGYLESPLYKEVELAYEELWLESSNVLSELLYENCNRVVYQKNKGHLRRIQEAVKTFAPTAFYYEAMNVLHTNGYVMLSGKPGVGKTSTAYNLAYYFVVNKGYEQIYVVDDIEEVYQLIVEDKKQFFILDDFWGRSKFSRTHLGVNWEKRLLNLLDDIQNFDNSLLVVTTREFVLQQGLRHYAELEERCNSEKILINVDAYTLNQKAEILFRHVYESNLEWDFVHLIYIFNKKIVEHPNYTPRVVSYFCTNVSTDEKDCWEYFAELKKFIGHPHLYWEEIFRNLSDGAKKICFSLALSEEEILIYELEETFLGLTEGEENRVNRTNFESYLKELEGMFIDLRVYDESKGELIVDFINHSLRDFIEEYIKKNIRIYEKVFINGLKFFNQLYYMIFENPFDMSDCAVDAGIQRLIGNINLLKFSYIYNLDVDWNYTVKHDTREYFTHKIWLLMLIYRERKNEGLAEFLSQYVHMVYNNLNDKDMGFRCNELIGIAEVVPEIYKCGIQLPVEMFIKAYYCKVEWVKQYYYMDLCFIKDFGEIYMDFRKKHIGEIQSFIKNLVFEDIDCYYEEDEIDMFVDMLPDIFEQFGMEYTDEFKKEVYASADLSWTSKGEVSQSIRHELYEPEQEEQEYDEFLEERIRPWLLGEDECLEEDELAHLIVVSPLADELKSYLLEHRDGYLWNSKFIREDFCSILDYFYQAKKIPNNLYDFYNGFSEYLEKDIETIAERAQISRLAEILIQKGSCVFIESSDYIQSWKAMAGIEFLDGLCENGILHKNGKWFSFMNEELLCYYGLKKLMNADNDAWEHFYNNELLELIYEHGIAEFLLCFAMSQDIEFFNKHFIAKHIDEFLTMNEASEEETMIKQFLQLIDMTVTIAKGEHDCFSLTHDPVFEIVEVIEYSWIGDIWEDMKSFAQEMVGETDQIGGVEIRITELTEKIRWYDIMCQKGLHRNIIRLYGMLKESQIYLQEHCYKADLFSFWKNKGGIHPCLIEKT